VIEFPTDLGKPERIQQVGGRDSGGFNNRKSGVACEQAPKADPSACCGIKPVARLSAP